MTDTHQALAVVVFATWIARDAFSMIASRGIGVQDAERIVDVFIDEERGRAFLVAKKASRWAFELSLFALLLWVMR